MEHGPRGLLSWQTIVLRSASRGREACSRVRFDPRGVWGAEPLAQSLWLKAKEIVRANGAPPIVTKTSRARVPHARSELAKSGLARNPMLAKSVIHCQLEGFFRAGRISDGRSLNETCSCRRRIAMGCRSFSNTTATIPLQSVCAPGVMLGFSIGSFTTTSRTEKRSSWTVMARPPCILSLIHI